MSLEETIVHEIGKKGPIGFRKFMEMCLYYPGMGYYTSPTPRIGTPGDYYTSPCISEVFGQMIARQIAEMWIALGKQPFTIVEMGGGSGKLCSDILHALKENKSLYKNLRYVFVEKNLMHARTVLAEFHEKMSWHESLEEIDQFEGCFLSNELVDNFSVHQVLMENQLMEIMVSYKDSCFTEVLHPASKILADYFKKLNVQLPFGLRTEINLQAIHWMKTISAKMRKGFVLTIDYGYTSDELYQPYRKSGNMICYHEHKRNYCPYQNIGKQDITAHINFSALKLWGAKFNLLPLGFTSQAHFLSGLGIGNLRSLKLNSRDAVDAIKALLWNIGTKIKVFIQQKNMNAAYLSGLSLSNPL
ncbi:class I SAM-dependent methyltransferase [Terrimonas pollutisoli]|uniref:class I SAM-dependent methyltransferase n=1 Tax=Terrimonas pollutisoli TaxID=3034147 RepID=UPI0023ED24C3|nr:SAM-dependent methyltransferase [Terrimonas sp. H1YJ31]